MFAGLFGRWPEVLRAGLSLKEKCPRLTPSAATSTNLVVKKTVLYKFSPEPNLTTLERLRGLVEDQKLYVNRPVEFNDPFEFKVVLDLEADEETHRKNYVANKPGSSDEQFLSWRAGLAQSRWSIEQGTREALLDRFGVACFTGDWENELFWAHYARNHTGFCVGFDEAALKSLEDIEQADWVSYTRTAPVFNPFKELPEAFQKKVVFHKSEAWKYEGEFRLLLRKHGKLDLPSGAIREVIIGCRAPNELREYGRSLAKAENGPAVYQATECLREFKIDRVPMDDTVYMTSHF